MKIIWTNKELKDRHKIGLGIMIAAVLGFGISIIPMDETFKPVLFLLILTVGAILYE